MTSNTVIVYTYRYIWKEKGSQNLCVKFLTGTQEEHSIFQKNILENEKIASCLREYVNEVNFAYLGFTEEVKKEKKNDLEVKEDEEICDVGQ